MSNVVNIEVGDLGDACGKIAQFLLQSIGAKTKRELNLVLKAYSFTAAESLVLHAAIETYITKLASQADVNVSWQITVNP